MTTPTTPTDAGIAPDPMKASDPTIAAILAQAAAVTPAPEAKPAEPTPLPTPAAEPPISLRRLVIYHELEGDQIVPRVGLCVKVWSNECCNLVVYNERGESSIRTSVSKVELPDPNSPHGKFTGIQGRWAYNEVKA